MYDREKYFKDIHFDLINTLRNIYKNKKKSKLPLKTIQEELLNKALYNDIITQYTKSKLLIEFLPSTSNNAQIYCL